MSSSVVMRRRWRPQASRETVHQRFPCAPHVRREPHLCRAASEELCVQEMRDVIDGAVLHHDGVAAHQLTRVVQVEVRVLLARRGVDTERKPHPPRAWTAQIGQRCWHCDWSRPAVSARGDYRHAPQYHLLASCQPAPACGASREALSRFPLGRAGSPMVARCESRKRRSSSRLTGHGMPYSSQ